MSQGMSEEEAKEKELRDFLDELGISMKLFNNNLYKLFMMTLEIVLVDIK